MKKTFDRERLLKKFRRRHTSEYGILHEGMIIQFVREYAFLSNFYPVEIEVEGMKFPTVENAYQALKLPKEYRKFFLHIMPGEAKRLARSFINKEMECEEYFYTYFEKQKVDIMRDLLRLKFNNSELGYKLKHTEPYILVEGNTWGDEFWGVDLRKPDAEAEFKFRGNNMLGRLLMEIRKTL